jgi:glyoxylase-like metal-dependent hydrolase (beta-lactamase superfamily II)
MELESGIHALSIDVAIEDREMTLNPVAVETPRGLLLLDVGLPEGIEDLAAALDAAGLDIETTWGVIITHQDIDHAGCVAAVVERTGAVVFAHEGDAPYVEGEIDLEKASEDRPISYPPATVDVRLFEGETFATNAGPMQAVFTPGHTPGHTSFYFPEERLLVAADAMNVVDGALVGPREDATPHMETAWESVSRLAELDVEQVLCYHGGFIEVGTDRIESVISDR